MAKNPRVSVTFTGYTMEDCACIYCLFYIPRKGCIQKVCCCAEEKRLAMEREKRLARQGV